MYSISSSLVPRPSTSRPGYEATFHLVGPPRCLDHESSGVIPVFPLLPHCRVATPLDYFLSDSVYAPKENLESVRTIPLLVVTIPVLEPCRDRGREGEGCEGGRGEQGACGSSGSCASGCANNTEEPAGGEGKLMEAGASPSSDTLEGSCVQKSLEEEEETCPPSEKRRKMIPPSHRLPSPPTHTPTPSLSPKLPPPPPHPLLSKAEEVVCGVLEGEGRRWILDVDLDFFSTANPFKKDFTSVSNMATHYCHYMLHRTCSAMH